jgi:response regulator of citrate/malate metabolism
VIRVLVVDDDFMVARLHSSVVARERGFELVGVAKTGAEAVRMARETRPDLVLLDVYLPDMTGLEVLKRLREPGRPAVDVIIISAARDLDTLRRAMHGGVFHYLVKPFEIDSLRERLSEYARHRSAITGLAEVSQADIDRVFRTRGASAESLPKNISAETMVLVVDALAGAGPDGISASDAAEVTGLSRSSTRRYLDHLVETGQAVMRPRYGAAGRPERRYHPAGRP